MTLELFGFIIKVITFLVNIIILILNIKLGNKLKNLEENIRRFM